LPDSLGARPIGEERLCCPGGNTANKWTAEATAIDKRSEPRLIIRSSVATLRGWQACRKLDGNILVESMAAILWTGWQHSHGLRGNIPVDWVAEIRGIRSMLLENEEYMAESTLDQVQRPVESLPL